MVLKQGAMLVPLPTHPLTGNPYIRRRLSTVDLLVRTGSNQLLQI
jgi:hypothetical protein